MANVALRWREYRDGSKVAYLDIYRGKGIKRERKLIDIKIKKSDTNKKELKEKAKQILAVYQNQILNKRNGLISDKKQDADFLQFFRINIESNTRPSVGKYIWAYNVLLQYLAKIKLVTLGKKDTTTKLITCNSIVPFSSIDEVFCKKFIKHIYDDAGLKGETPYTLMAQIKSIINRAVREQYFLVSPFENIKLSKPSREVDKDILTQDEVNKLFATDYPHEELKRVVAFALHTGSPDKECRLLTYGHLKDNKLSIYRAKSKVKVIIPLSESALNAIGIFGKSTQRVFKLPSDTTIKKHLQRWIALAGIDKHITFYCLRHSYAVLLLSSGANLKTVADLMGHTDITHTIKYLEHTDILKDEAINLLPHINIDVNKS